MKRGRYNIVLPNGEIKKFNVYMNYYSTYFIHFEGLYQMIKRASHYRGGWLWELKDNEQTAKKEVEE